MLTQEYLKECLKYCPETGLFTWLVRPVSHFRAIRAFKAFNSYFAGKTAGTLDNNGYIRIKIDGRLYLAHRLAWLYINGCLPPCQIDHISHNRADNRIINLRDVDRAENMKNITMCKANNSGFNGVDLRKNLKKWRARAGVNGKSIHLGYFDSMEDAVAARKSFNNLHFHKNHGY